MALKLKHTVVLSKERANELYGPLGRPSSSSLQTHKTIVEWCDATVGRHERLNYRTWIFEREEDAVLFNLTWA
jgi:hypothetical protein